VRALRYYEELKLIQATTRSEGGYRLYDEGTARRVHAIVALQELNYSLEDILQLLGSAVDESFLTQKSQRIERTRTVLERQQQCLNEKMTHLAQLQADLEKRLALLETQCMPCSTHNSSAEDCKHCEHQHTHWN
jgi:MerR family Zn(II)-responsive transcriptional regulator of zntA